MPVKRRGVFRWRTHRLPCQRVPASVHQQCASRATTASIPSHNADDVAPSLKTSAGFRVETGSPAFCGLGWQTYQWDRANQIYALLYERLGIANEGCRPQHSIIFRHPSPPQRSLSRRVPDPPYGQGQFLWLQSSRYFQEGPRLHQPMGRQRERLGRVLINPIL
jgi:hypothetical protein